MSEIETRKEILDLLARGKISIDEAVELLDKSKRSTDSTLEDEPLFKAEMEEGFDAEDVLRIKVDEEMASEDLPDKEKEFVFEDPTPAAVKHNGGQPRWLRVQVINSETGKNKVSVNVPFAMVRFGLGIARVFSPEVKGVDIDELSEVFTNAESGLLVDVQDDESNEHVKIFFD